MSLTCMRHPAAAVIRSGDMQDSVIGTHDSLGSWAQRHPGKRIIRQGGFGRPILRHSNVRRISSSSAQDGKAIFEGSGMT